MKDLTTKGLGGIKNIAGLLNIRKAGKTSAADKTSGSIMSGVSYAKFNEHAAIPKSNVQVPAGVIDNYANVGAPSDYKPFNAEQTNAFYEELKNQPMNETDIASNKYLDEEAFV